MPERAKKCSPAPAPAVDSVPPRGLGAALTDAKTDRPQPPARPGPRWRTITDPPRA